MPKAETKPRANTKKASTKGKKDENAPKRALSAYMYMSQEWRPRVKEENDKVSFGEIGRLLGAKWKEMGSEERKPYEDMAAADKARYEKEKKEYESSKEADKVDDDDDEDEKKSKNSKKSTKSKKPAKKEEIDDDEEEAKSDEDDE
ncbi:hypothetical protein E3P92_00317 [Wallemia ichthyophaga]|uniref:HMG box domain-containing protein n=2 Tax=Wallemia ichthyophaga TaxID=245174 RepID=A0A4T0IHE9_WALIC|nr:Non-histone chromosomal protein 6 [Wallemia ichthyophaga EXF-994]TIA80783.1 hypothetical protein E3P98_02508 [Wallemia ichthyophaga]EOR00877.1 Non-histone chromosomal protein 6 [Wallemia ichthyophaga EXF-994]TIA89603.1 hypothetical protein E3P97_02947 [Wallemia ichthyophaga]TIB03849.1 hypothetical protein E3P95_00382 [Wallemia ichthyophaga]TIB04986.1 hypothetical protein E3P94_00382 [Wallemia ichthyophaga]